MKTPEDARYIHVGETYYAWAKLREAIEANDTELAMLKSAVEGAQKALERAEGRGAELAQSLEKSVIALRTACLAAAHAEPAFEPLEGEMQARPEERGFP
jgi:prefoldin subunit 5